VTRPGPGVDMDSGEGSEMSEAPDLEEQAGIVGDFVQGLVDAFGLDATVTHQAGDDEDGSVEVHVDGDHLGLLIGPRGHSLEAIQELARTVLQRHTVGAPNARVRIDVAGYRQRRREALERFALQVAEEAKAAGVRKVLEPMNAADRKVVHDAVNDIEGVSTTSEGEDPRRRVVIVPDAPADTAPADTAPADTAPADAAPADIGPADIGPADMGPADIAPADIGPADIAPADIGPDDAGLDES